MKEDSVTAFSNRRSLTWLGASLLFPLLLLLAACGADPTPAPTPAPTPTPTAPTEPTEPTDPTDPFEAEWQELIAAAQAEGELVVITGGAASRIKRPIVEEFGRLFNIRTTTATGSDGEHVDRILAERQAGRYLVDVTFLGPTTSRGRAIPAGLFAELPPYLIHPEVLDTSLWWGGQHFWSDEEGKFLMMFSGGVSPSAISFFYNTDNISQEEIDRIESVWDFLNEDWTYAALPLDDAGAGGTWFRVMVHPEMGPEFVERFLHLDIRFTPEARQITDWIAGGVVDGGLGLGAAGRDILALRNEGLPVDEFTGQLTEAAERAGSGSSNNIAIFTNAAHPDAAKLFVNWFLSVDGQTVYHTHAEGPPDPTFREDVADWGKTLPEERPQPGREYLNLAADPQFLAVHDEAMQEVARMYREIVLGQ